MAFKVFKFKEISYVPQKAIDHAYLRGLQITGFLPITKRAKSDVLAQAFSSSAAFDYSSYGVLHRINIHTDFCTLEPLEEVLIVRR